jgi:hypothetical protein
MRVPINKFFEYFYDLWALNPECTQKDIYELTEQWYKWKFGRNRYRNYDVFRTRFHYYLKNIKNKRQ